MVTADHRKAVGMVAEAAALVHRDVLLAGVYQPGLDLVLRRRRAHAQPAVLGVEDDLAAVRHMVRDQRRDADAQIDIPSLLNIRGGMLRHLLAAEGLKGKFG